MLKRKIGSFLKDERGQGLAEYIIVVALVGIAAIGAVSLFGNNIQAVFSTATDVFHGGEGKAKTSKGNAPKPANLSNFGEK